MTPIQLIQAAGAVANNGKMMQPYVIEKIVDPNSGTVIENNKPKVKGTPISADTAKEVRRILASTVTSEKGTAKNFASKEYSVAGKTGTAQIPNKSGGYYWGKGEFLYSFLGMAPEKNPQLVMYIAVEKPHLKASELGSEPTSKIFNAVMQSSLKYLNVETETSQVPELESLKDYVSQDVLTASKEVKVESLEPIIIGQQGKVTAQYPPHNTKLLKSSKVFFKTQGAIIVPSFKGWSLRDVLAYGNLSGLNMTVKGNGFVTKQSLPEGTILDGKETLLIELKTPSEQYSKVK